MHRLLDDRLKSFDQRLGGRALEILSRRIVAAREDPLRVVHAHSLRRVDEKSPRFGHRRLGRAVHAKDQLIGMPVHADRAHHRFESTQGRRQGNLDAVVPEKPVFDAQARDGGMRASRKRLLESVDGFTVGNVVEARGPHGSWNEK